MSIPNSNDGCEVGQEWHKRDWKAEQEKLKAELRKLIPPNTKRCPCCGSKLRLLSTDDE